MIRFCCYLFLILGIGILRAKSPEVVSGPMLGHTSNTTARVWVLLANTDSFLIELNQQKNYPYKLIHQEKQGKYWSVIIQINQLQVGQDYQLTFIGKHKKMSKTPFSFKLLEENRPTKMVLGSCAYTPPRMLRWMTPSKQYIYKHMNEVDANTMLWLGDNHYFLKYEYYHHPRKFKRYVKQRTHLKINRFLKNGWSHYAIWDDHDYGPNNSLSDYSLKSSSLMLHQAFWPNPYHGLANDSGIYTHFSQKEADFFLLDVRYHKTSLQADHRTLLGEKQLNWLLTSIKASKKPFKFIITGSQFVNDKSSHDAFHHYQEERQKIIDFIKDQKVSGVIFISGDKHYSELLKMPVQGAYPLYDFTCSPLTSYVHGIDPNENDPWRVKGTLVKDQNFGTLEIYNTTHGLMCVMQVYSNRGKLLWRHEILQKELSFNP